MMRVLLGIVLLLPVLGLADELTAHEERALAYFKELIETDTTHSTGDTALAARKMAAHLLAAGFPAEDVHVIENAPRKGNLVARLRSPAPVKPPVLFLAHIDVVEANPEDWTIPPFTFLERDGYYYGRGTADDKDEAAIHVANLIRLFEEGFEPNRDIIIALTADEEGGQENGVQYLLEHHRDLVDAAFVINEGGGGTLIMDNPVTQRVQTAEKVYQSYILEVTNRGGHSSRPRKDNAIYQLARALSRIEGHEFPVSLNETTRATFAALASTEKNASTAALYRGVLETPPDPASIEALTWRYGPILRTTCVATMLDAGHAENALPQRARATVNCRVLPGVPVESVRTKLAEVIDDNFVSITPVQAATPSDPSPLTAEVMGPINALTSEMWPGTVVVPSMSAGATDGLFFRNAGIPVYGTSGIFSEQGDVRAHGRDERIMKRSFFEGLEYLYRLARAYGSPVDEEPKGPAL